MLRMSSDGFTPTVTGEFGGLASDSPLGPGAPPPPEITRVGNKIVSAFSNLAPISLKASQEKTFRANLSLPKHDAVVPGSLIMTRAEYWYDGVLAAFGPPATTYIAHPLPPNNGGPNDVLIFCHQGFRPHDFTMLDRFFKVLLCALMVTRVNSHSHACIHIHTTYVHTHTHTHQDVRNASSIFGLCPLFHSY